MDYPDKPDQWDIFIGRRGNHYRRTKNSYEWEEEAVKQEILFHKLARQDQVLCVASGSRVVMIPILKIPISKHYSAFVFKKGERWLFNKAITDCWVIDEPAEVRRKLGSELKITG